jgi:hypothetical protein
MAERQIAVAAESGSKGAPAEPGSETIANDGADPSSSGHPTVLRMRSFEKKKTTAPISSPLIRRQISASNDSFESDDSEAGVQSDSEEPGTRKSKAHRPVPKVCPRQITCVTAPLPLVAAVDSCKERLSMAYSQHMAVC